MKKNYLILALIAVLLVSIATAAPTLISPSSTSARITGSYAFNATTALVNSANCTFTIVSAGKTANTTSVSMGTYVNTSARQLINFTVVYNSALIEDGTDYVITVECRNETGSSETTIFSGYTVDNTVPVAASTLSPAAGVRVSTDGQLFSGTVTGARTTACTLKVGQNIMSDLKAISLD